MYIQTANNLSCGLDVADRAPSFFGQLGRDLIEAMFGTCVLGCLRHDVVFSFTGEGSIAIDANVSAI
jgi:hypothetical protein